MVEVFLRDNAESPVRYVVDRAVHRNPDVKRGIAHAVAENGKAFDAFGVRRIGSRKTAAPNDIFTACIIKRICFPRFILRTAPSNSR